jgi:hypothetical protein
MTDTPRMTNQPDPDDEAWNDILELERELAAEAAGEPARSDRKALVSEKMKTRSTLDIAEISRERLYPEKGK